ncbi:MAG: DUF3592 domain-containing protein [Candidatus Gracilibacteria bacterium]
MNRIKIIQYVFTAIGSAALLVCICLTINTLNFINKSKEANGKIIDLAYESHYKGHIYYPVVQFKTLDNQDITFKANIGNNPPLEKIGDTVDVFYDPESPNDASIKSLFLWFGSLLSGFFVLIFGGIGLGFMIASKRSEKRSNDNDFQYRTNSILH